MSTKLYLCVYGKKAEVTFMNSEQALLTYETINANNLDAQVVPIRFTEEVLQHELFFNDDGNLCIKESE